MLLARVPGLALAKLGRAVPKLVVSLGCAAGLFAAMAACSSRTPDWSQPASVSAQPTVGQPTTDPGQLPTLPGCPCVPSVELDVTVTDPAGNPASGVTFPRNMGVCIGWGSHATPDAGALDAADAGAPDGDVLDGGSAYDAAAPDAAEAGEGACTTWRFLLSPPATGVLVVAPGYEWGTAGVTWSSACCEGFGTVPVVDRTVVLQPLPSCPASWGPCSRDAGLRGSPTSCICP